MRRVLLLAISLFALSSSAKSSPPGPEERLAATAIVVAQWHHLPPGEAKSTQATAAAMLVQHAAGVVAGGALTAEQQQALTAVVQQLQQRGVDARPVVNASIADFSRYACRSKQLEAKSSLRAVYIAEASHFAEVDRYSADLAQLGYDPSSSSKRYRYAITEATAQGFRATAVGVDDMAGDEWVVTAAGRQPTAVKDVCAGIVVAVVDAPLPLPPKPTPAEVVTALSTLSRSVDVTAEADKVAVLAVATVALHEVGVDGPASAQNLDAARLKGLVASVKKQGGDLVAVLRPVLDAQAEQQCRHDRYYAEHAVREVAGHYHDGSYATTLYGTAALANYEIEQRGTTETFTVKAKGTGPMKGDVIVETEQGLQKPKTDFCANKKSTVLGTR